MKKFFISFLLAVLLLTEIFCIKMIPVLTRTFPLKDVDAVLFTLTQNVSGAGDFAYSLVTVALKESLILFLLMILVVCVFLFLINLLKIKKRISYKSIIGLLCAGSFVFFIIKIYLEIPIVDYYVAWKGAVAIPEHSDFYLREYVNPDSVDIVFKEKKNLILVFLESMESNFQDSINGGNLSENFIPEITKYIKEEQSFIPGGKQVSGTGWTIADAVAKTCGIPLFFPPSISNSFASLDSFLPGATCMTDILEKNGYSIVVSQGSNVKFASMEGFLKTHNVSQYFDMMSYMNDPRVMRDSLSHWGVKDMMHYALVKEHIDRLAKNSQPWMVWFFTIDTHTPGYLDSRCASDSMTSSKNELALSIRCASRQIDEFLKWAKSQVWFDKTTIVVVGDHAMMAAPEIVGFKDSDITHYWLDFFVNSAKTTENYRRQFTSMDMFPTILESIGAGIPEGALGLGRSLYSNSPTLLEKYGLDSLNRALGKRSIEYDYFLFFEKNKK